MTLSRDAIIKYCDVAIVGGGIAGLSIAERLGREAKRQGKRIRVLLIEQHEQLGMGASGGLEGWYHTGALYAKLPYAQLQIFQNMLNGFEDLYNWYYFDTSFPFHRHCNLRDITETRRPEYLLRPGATDMQRHGAWFIDALTYLIPERIISEDPEKQRLESHEWSRIPSQLRSLVFQAFFDKEWVDDSLGCCQNPYVGYDIRIPDGPVEPFGELLRQHGRNAAEAELSRVAADSELCAVMNNVRQAEGGTELSAMLSRDVALDSWQVLRDLTESAMLHGVEVLLGHKLEPESVHISPYGAVDQVKGLLLRRESEPGGEPVSAPHVHVIASQYVFALGMGFDENELLHRRLGVHVRVEKNVSVMAVASPPLCNQSFVRVDLRPTNDFNHMLRRTCSGAPYSVVADSNSLPISAPISDRVSSTVRLLEKAEQYFGAKMRHSQLAWYFCDKTTFPPADETHREYSYFLGPNWAEWEHGWWKEQLEKDRGSTVARLRKYIAEGAAGLAYAPEITRRPIRVEQHASSTSDKGSLNEVDRLRLSESSWALKKAIHFASLRCARAQRNHAASPSVDTQRELEVARDTFVRVRDFAVRAFELKSQQQPSRRPNFLCVIPGKFSLFPTLAHQVTSELEIRGLLRQLPASEPGESNEEWHTARRRELLRAMLPDRLVPDTAEALEHVVKTMVGEMIAQPHPERLLGELERQRFPLRRPPPPTKSTQGA